MNIFVFGMVVMCNSNVLKCVFNVFKQILVEF